MRYNLIATWTEPYYGSECWIAELNDAEAARVQSVLDWLEEHAGPDYGYSLPEWQLVPGTKSRHPVADFNGIIWELATNSRYDETEGRGILYQGRNEQLEFALENQ